MEFVAALATNECGAWSEIALLGGSVILGWLVATLLLTVFERRLKLQKKIVGHDFCACGTRELSYGETHTEFDNSEYIDERVLSEQPCEPNQELKICGPFCAAPGAWSQPAQGVINDDLCAESFDDELADVEDELERGNNVFLTAPDLSAKGWVASLCEQYEIFGCSPGEWCSSSASTTMSEGRVSTTVSEDETEPELSDDDIHCKLETIWDDPLMMPTPPDGSALAELWEHYGLLAAPAGTWS